MSLPQSIVQAGAPGNLAISVGAWAPTYVQSGGQNVLAWECNVVLSIGTGLQTFAATILDSDLQASPDPTKLVHDTLRTQFQAAFTQAMTVLLPAGS